MGRIDEQQALADDWNRRNVTGRVVRVRLDNGAERVTVTRSGASLYRGDTAVLFVRGIPGYFALERVQPDNGHGAIPDYATAGGGAICGTCGFPLYDHPDDLAHPGLDGLPFLTRLCDGRVVKL